MQLLTKLHEYNDKSVSYTFASLFTNPYGYWDKYEQH